MNERIEIFRGIYNVDNIDTTTCSNFILSVTRSKKGFFINKSQIDS